MSVITISRGSYSRGKDVAEKVARKMGYECISRDILLEASEAFNIPEIKLVRAIHDAPSVLERFTHGQDRYISYIRKVLLQHVQKDNVVYHGLAGHYFLLNIPHVFKVRIIADMEDRVKEEVERVKIPADKARYLLKKDDEERRKWGLQLYGIDTWDSQLYDMVLHIKTITVDDAVEIISQAVAKPVFQTTPDSQAIVDDLLLAATVQAELVKVASRLNVTASGGIVTIGDMEGLLNVKQGVADEIRKIAGQVAGVQEVRLLTLEKSDGYASVNPFHNL